MKNTKALLIIGIAALAMVINSQAQTATNVQSFFSQVYTWGTTFDTNSTTFLSTRGMFDTGVESRTGDALPLLNDIHGQYDVIGHTYDTPTNVTDLRFGFDALERNSGLSGTFASGEAGIQFAIVHYDFRFGGGVDGGYWAKIGDNPQRFFAEAFIDADKALGSRTFMGLRFNQELTRNAQGIYGKFGFNF